MVLSFCGWSLVFDGQRSDDVNIHRGDRVPSDDVSLGGRVAGAEVAAIGSLVEATESLESQLRAGALAQERVDQLPPPLDLSKVFDDGADLGISLVVRPFHLRGREEATMVGERGRA